MINLKLSMHHIAISVKDINESVDWYQQLGFEEKHRYTDPNGAFFIVQMQLGDMCLELFCFKAQQNAPETSTELSTDLPRIGVKHFAFKVDDIAQAKNALEQASMAPDVSIMQGKTGVSYFFIKDPNGILVEFVQDSR